MHEMDIPVTGMHCEGCVRSLTQALLRVPGVAEVEVSLEPGRAWLRCDPARVARAQLVAAIEAAGFQAD